MEKAAAVAVPVSKLEDHQFLTVFQVYREPVPALLSGLEELAAPLVVQPGLAPDRYFSAVDFDRSPGLQKWLAVIIGARSRLVLEGETCIALLYRTPVAGKDQLHGMAFLPRGDFVGCPTRPGAVHTPIVQPGLKRLCAHAGPRESRVISSA